MYDDHISPKFYNAFKSIIKDILNGDDNSTDVYHLKESVNALYYNGKLSATQYDNLISDLDDMLI